MIKIELYQKTNQVGIDSMMHEIAKEFEVSIFNKNPSAPKLIDKFWVASQANEIIGTISILKIKNENAVLKSMFVKKNYRGKNIGLSKLLLQTAFDWCSTEGIKCIYLGTMSQFIAAHKFYEKNGFKKIIKSDLPINFIDNPLDDVFYKMTFSS